MSNVIIQKINLYDLELQGNSSSDEEEENVAKNQQKQPSITSYLTKKSPRQQNTENGAEKLIECQVSADLGKSSSTEVDKVVKSPVISRKSNETQHRSAETAKIPKISSATQKSATDSSNSSQLIHKASNQAVIDVQQIQQPNTTPNPSTNIQTSSNLPTEVVIKEELIELDDDPVIQQTWQDLDQHSFIKQENELMVPPDSLDGENIMEDEIEEQDLIKIMSQSHDPENANASFDDYKAASTQNPEEAVEDSESLKLNGELGTLDEKFGFFYKESENSNKSVEQPDEDIMTSQDIPVDFDDSLMELEGNPAKRMRIDATEAHKVPNKVYTHTIVKSLPKGITVKRTSGRQVACKSTSAVASHSPVKPSSSDPENSATVIAKIGENLAKIGETFVKFGTSVKNSEQLLPCSSKTTTVVSPDQDEVFEIKEEPVDDMEIDEEYTEEFLEEPTGPEPEKILSDSELAKSFTKNIGIVHKVSEMANRIVDRINAKRSEAAAQKVGVSPKKFGLDPSKVGGNFIKVLKGSPAASKVVVSTKVIQNPLKILQNSLTAPQRLTMPSTSYFMPTNFQDVKIKEEKLDDDTSADPQDPSNFLEAKIKEKDTDEYFTTAYNQNTATKPLNSTVTSTSDTIVSTKVVTLPASNLLKSRKIIVIKKPVTPGAKPVSGHSIQRALKSQMRSNPSSSNGTENTRYIIKTVSMPNKTVKIENSPKSSLQISNISSAQNQGPTTSFKSIIYPKSASTVVVKKQSDAIYRCQKCHLLFSSHSDYTEHLKEHRIPQGIVFNEKRVIKLEELQKMNAFQCAQCSAGFPTMEKLSAHENRHKTEFCCKICGKTFLQMFRYKEHLAQHEKKKEKYLECEHCDKKFLKQVRLDEHVMNAHAIREPNICPYCDLKFPTSAMLVDHQKTVHTKKTAMKCGLCNYETYVKQNFEKHASMHMRYVEKLNSKQFFKCDQCPQSFREIGVLEMHKQHMHS